MILIEITYRTSVSCSGLTSPVGGDNAQITGRPGPWMKKKKKVEKVEQEKGKEGEG